MARVRFSSREWTLALVAGVVIGTSLLVIKVMAPLWDQLTRLRARESVSQEKLERWRSLVARRAQIEHAYARYATFRNGDVPERVQATLLSELEELARASNVQMALKPRPIQSDERAHQIGVELQLDGSQAAVLGFLDRLLSWPRLIIFDRIRLSSAASAERPLRANVIMSVSVLRPLDEKPAQTGT